jgi:protein phosphatase
MHTAELSRFKLSPDTLRNHSTTNIKKISLEDGHKFQTIKQDDDDEELYENFISNLLKPNDWKINLEDTGEISRFRFRREHIIALTKACQEIVASQPIILQVNTPIKIFGDIHGQYEDLMRFFELWGEPSYDGDINNIDYLFLGDYVDRGVYSLETICLLMALKIKYPDKIHMLRGNHEDILINSTFGFLEECQYRLADDNNEELAVFKAINDFFEYLPLGAIVDDEIFCLHGGIGGCLDYISEIEKIQRPLQIVHEATNKTEQIVMDILWSDPTENDEELGIQQNMLRDSKGYGNIVKFGPDVVNKFLNNNKLSMIIRAHECVLDGFERFSGGNLITVFSATDYCKRHKNAGAMLVVSTNYEIVPHLIYPTNSSNKKWLDNEESLKKRPPTPLRSRKR